MTRPGVGAGDGGEAAFPPWIRIAPRISGGESEEVSVGGIEAVGADPGGVGPRGGVGPKGGMVASYRGPAAVAIGDLVLDAEVQRAGEGGHSDDRRAIRGHTVRVAPSPPLIDGWARLSRASTYWPPFWT